MKTNCCGQKMHAVASDGKFMKIMVTCRKCNKGWDISEETLIRERDNLVISPHLKVRL